MTDRQTIEMALTKVNELEKRIRMLSRVAAALGLGCFFLLLGMALVVANSSSKLQSRHQPDRAIDRRREAVSG